MIYTSEDDERFKEATKCHICNKDFVIAEIPHCHREHEKTCELCPSIIVRDHCHILGVSNNIHISYSLQFSLRSLTKLNILLFIQTFRGAAHQSCNLNYRINPKKWKLPIFFHNLRGYDGHLLIKAAHKRHGNIRVVPTNMEKYLAITIGQVCVFPYV